MKSKSSKPLAVKTYIIMSPMVFELTVIGLIIGLISLFAVPAISSQLHNQHLFSAVETFNQDIQKARAVAIRQNRNVAICANNNWNPGSNQNPCSQNALSTNWANGWYTLTEKKMGSARNLLCKGRVLNLNGDIQIVPAFVATSQLIFHPSGALQPERDFLFSICDQRGKSAGQLLTIHTDGRVIVSPLDENPLLGCNSTRRNESIAGSMASNTEESIL